MPESFQEQMAILAGFFNLRREGAAADSVPDLAFSVDQNLIDTVNGFDLASVEVSLNALKVEELLESTLSRVANCLSLREKAHEIQVRALLDSIENKYHRDLMLAQIEVDSIVSPGPAGSNLPQLRTDQERSITASFDAKKSASDTRGHGSNYPDRYSFLKELFDISLLQAIARAKLTERGLRLIYGINDLPLPSVTANGYLNALTKWVQNASDRLDLALDGRRRRTVSIVLSSYDENVAEGQVYPKGMFIQKLQAGAFDFSLTADLLRTKGLQDPLLREIRLQIVTNEAAVSRMWHMSIRPPAHLLIAGDATFPCVGISGDVAGTESFAISSDVHNLSPVGEWLVRLPAKTLTGEATEPIVSNVILHLTVSSRRL